MSAAGAWGTRWLVVAGVIAVLLMAGCARSSGDPNSSAPTASCPAVPLKVVVTTNVWASVVDQLSGACAEVVTIVSSPADDPHDFEPTAAMTAKFAAADIAVMNGLGYDPWSQRIVDSLGSSAPTVINLGEVVGLHPGDNPHIWYSPTYVQQAATSISAVLAQRSTAATAVFEAQSRTFAAGLRPYLGKIAQIKQQFGGTVVGATESLVDYLAQACGLSVSTPRGFLNAQASGAEPTPRDVQIFRRQLSDGTDRALLYNTQTDGSLPQQFRAIALAHSVPVVDFTETLVPAGATFQQWQLAQLNQLGDALTQSR